MAESEEITNYKEKLKAHDWYWERSDDSRYHRRGGEERKELDKLQRALDPELEIWNALAPKDFKRAKPIVAGPRPKPF